MTTIRLYYDRPDERSTDATVVAVSALDAERSRLVLDQTNFYPEGGGQPCDTGTIAGFSVESVTEDVDGGDAIVAHVILASVAVLAESGIKAGALVHCDVDVERRRGHSEQHTAQHLLSAIMARRSRSMTLSFHLGERYSSVDVDTAPMPDDEVDAVEGEFMRVARADMTVTTHLCPPEDVSAFPLRKEPTVEAGVLRVVDIGGLDYSACCGTHVVRTGELSPFRIIKVEKYKGGSRIHFLAGGRAMADYGRLARVSGAAATAAGVSEDELPDAVSACKEKTRRLEKELAEAWARSADWEAAALDAASAPGTAVVAKAERFEYGSRLARALAARGRTAVVLCVAELKAVAASPGGGSTDAAAKFGPIAVANGGKGGGGRSFYQAAFPDAASLEAFMAGSQRPVEVPYR